MNRQLKFRIWDKQNKKWLENSSSLHCYSNWTICPFTGNLVDYVGTFDGDHEESFTASPAADYYLEGAKFVKEPRYVIQQYTGLEDKNGTPIFEGDLVKAYFKTEEIGDITFDRAGFCFNSKSLNGTFLGIVESGFPIEVVGNIFENK
jgi:uncharacterized phage protein (TIGR01671 family)